MSDTTPSRSTSNRPAGAIDVRRATAADLPALQATDPRPERGIPAKRLAEQDAGTGVFGVATLDGQVVGMGFLDFIDEELQPEMKNLWVDPAARRHHVGSQLWRWLEQQAADAGHQQVFLAIDPNNSRALPMFLEFGYAPTGDHVFVEDPDTWQVLDPSEVSDHYAVYRKSLIAG